MVQDRKQAHLEQIPRNWGDGSLGKTAGRTSLRTHIPRTQVKAKMENQSGQSQPSAPSLWFQKNHSCAFSEGGGNKEHFCAFYKTTCYYNPLEHIAVLTPSLGIWERSIVQVSLSCLVLYEIPWKLESCCSAYRNVLCACVCTLVFMHVEVIGQLWFSFLRCCLNWFLFKGIIGMVANRLCWLYCLLSEPQWSVWLLPQCWDCKPSHCHSRFLLMWVLGGWNLDLHVCKISTFPKQRATILALCAGCSIH